MNNMEEMLWNYIDGSCTPAQQKAVEELITQDVEYRHKYEELLALNAEFSTMELDEPPMAFTYNVMEGIRTETARQPLKAAINKRIILGIATFFIVAIAAIMVFAFSKVDWAAQSTNTISIKMPEQLSVTHIKSFFSGAMVQGFLFFDVVIGLFLLDHYMRKRSGMKA